MARTSPAMTEWNLNLKEIESALNASGFAVLTKALSGAQCSALARLYDDDSHFRSRVVMARHGYGRGEYKYFSYPLPKLVKDLRTALYPPLAKIANDWNTVLKKDVRFPPTHAGFLKRCHEAGQVRPTPLLLRYGA